MPYDMGIRKVIGYNNTQIKPFFFFSISRVSKFQKLIKDTRKKQSRTPLLYASISP